MIADLAESPELFHDGRSCELSLSPRDCVVFESHSITLSTTSHADGGPQYGPLGHGSFLPIIETLASNIVQCIQKMQKDRIKCLTPRPEVAEQFKEHAELFLKRTAWTSVS